jgi:hypothetical protein
MRLDSKRATTTDALAALAKLDEHGQEENPLI